MSQHKHYFSKGISEQILFLMSPLNPFYKLKYPSFSPTTLLYSFWMPQHQAIFFKRHFGTSSFLNVPLKPHFRSWSTHPFHPQLYYTDFWMLQHQAILFKAISEQVLFLLSFLNAFYKLKYPSFTPTTLLYSFLNAPTPSNTFQRAFQNKFFS